MSKSTALTPRDSHHFITVQPPVLHSDPKIAKKQMALWRKQIKTAKEERMIDAGREAAVTVGRGLLETVAQTGKGVAEAHGQMFRGWLGNTDPITWAAGGVAMVVYVTFLANMVRTIGKSLGISQDLATDLGLNYLTEQLPTTVNQTVSNIVGRDDKTGIFGIGITTSDGLNWTNDFRWYTNSTSRDAALLLLSPLYPDTLFQGDARTHVEAVNKVSAPGGTFGIPGTRLSRSLNHGRWAVIWINPPPSANVGTSVVVEVADDQATAVSLGISYHASLPDRTVIVQMM